MRKRQKGHGAVAYAFTKPSSYSEKGMRLIHGVYERTGWDTGVRSGFSMQWRAYVMIGTVIEDCLGRALVHEAHKEAKRGYETTRASGRLSIHAPGNLEFLRLN